MARVLGKIAARRNLNPPRRHRSCPRVVKRARYNFYRVKPRDHVGVRHTGPPIIELASATPSGTMITTKLSGIAPGRL
jgi:hypothetical protein